MTPRNAPNTEKSKPIVRSLPLNLWPAADKIAWDAACRPAERLKRGGAAGHLKPVTRNDLAQRYGYFLDFLARSHRLNPKAAAGAHVTARARARSYCVTSSVAVFRSTELGPTMISNAPGSTTRFIC